MYFLRLQTSIVWFLSLFGEGLMCMSQNFKLFCCADYILNLIVSICLSCWPNLWCSGVFSAAKIRLSRISAENMVQPAEFFEKSDWGVYTQPTLQRCVCVAVQRGWSWAVGANHQRWLHADGTRVRSLYATDLRRSLLHARQTGSSSRPQTREHPLRHAQRQRDQNHRLRTCQEVWPFEELQGRLEVTQVVYTVSQKSEPP